MTDREAYVAFNLTDNIGSVGVSRLVSVHGSPAAAWEAYPKKTSRSGGPIDWDAEFALARRYGVEMLTIGDKGYPERLRNSPGAPLVLYVKGNVEALSAASVAIVGTRRATTYGKDQAYRFGRDLAAAGWCVLSGLALGIDAESHRGALDAGGTTVGIIGSGLDRFYPEENRALAREIVEKGGAVVSEFPFGRSPDVQTFPQRNHVVAALSSGVLAVECPVKSGTLLTTSFAADLGRPVMALPGRVDSRSSAGCLNLIREGARLVRCPADVIEELSALFATGAKPGAEKEKEPAVSQSEFAALAGEQDAKSAAAPEKPSRGEEIEKRAPLPPFSIEEAIVMRNVDAEGVSLDRLVEMTGLAPSKLNSIVMTLRLKGRLRFLPGNRVATPRE